MTTRSQKRAVPKLSEVYSPCLRPGDYEGKLPPSDTDEKCPNCGEEFDSDEWDERHTHGGSSLGEDWHYTCPKCNNETLTVGI